MLTNKQKNIIYIIIILSVSMFFRFYDLTKRGLFEWDEGYYVELVKTYRAGFDWLLKTKLLNQDIGNPSDYILENGGTFGSVSKDGFAYFATLASIIFGMNENTILFTNALVGAITALLLYLFLKSRISQAGAFWIASVFSVSPYHIGYSRGGLSTILAALFLLISIYLYTRYLDIDKRSLLFYSALLLGLSFSCHYVVGLFVFVMFVYEACHLYVRRIKINRFLLLPSGFFIPLIIFESISRAVKFIISLRLPQLAISYNFATYFEEFFMNMLAADAGQKIKNIGPFYYLGNLIFHEGIIVIVILALALLILFYEKTSKLLNIFLIIIFTFPFVCLSLKYNSAGRVLLLFLPLIYFIIGYSFFYLNRFRNILVCIALIVVCLNAYRSLDYFNYRSNFDKAVSFMRAGAGIKHISDDMYVSRAYVGRINALDDFISVTREKGENYYVSLRKIKDFYIQGYRYFVLYDSPYYLNELTKAALAIEPDFSVESIGNNRNVDLGLLRVKSGEPCRYIYVYSLDRVIKKLEQQLIKD